MIRHVAHATALLLAWTAILRGQSRCVVGHVSSRGVAISGANIVLTSLPSGTSVLEVSNTIGYFRVCTAVDSARSVVVGASARGYASRQQALQSLLWPGDSVRVDFTLEPLAQNVRPVVVLAERPRPRRDNVGGGSRPGTRSDPLDSLVALSGDLTGDLSSALGMIPGVLLDGDGTIRAFGLGANSQGSTLNGTDFAAIPIPRDGLRNTIRLSSYDPRNGRFAGVQVNSTLPSGTRVALRNARLSLEDPSLQLPVGPSRVQDGRYRNVIGSGTVSGPLGTNDHFFNLAYQAGRRTQPDRTLESADAASLAAIGLASEVVTPLLLTAMQIGAAPAGLSARMPSIRDVVSAIGRVDLTPGDAESGERDVAYFLLGGQLRNESPAVGDLRSTGSRAASTRSSDGEILFSLSPYRRSALIDFKVGVGAHSEANLPSFRAPAAAVLVRSPSASGAELQQLFVGGSGVDAVRQRTVRSGASLDISWMTLDRSHRLNFYADATFERRQTRRGAGDLGTFTYLSLQDFAANKPESFRRIGGPGDTRTDLIQAALGISDVYYHTIDGRTELPLPGNGFMVQYGLRLDLARFLHSTPSNLEIERLTGFRTDRTPSPFSLSPMIGFSWNRGELQIQNGRGGTFSETRHAITGGVRMYTAAPPLTLMEAALAQAGGSVVRADVLCLGASTPVPDWPGSLRGSAETPSCIGATTPAVSLVAPSAAFFAESFTPPRNLRADLSWRWMASSHLTLDVSGAVALGLNGLDVEDLNLRSDPVFHLSHEGARPIFVSPLSIDTASGLPSVAASRASSTFSAIRRYTSAARSRFASLTIGASYRLGASAFDAFLPARTRLWSSTVRASYSIAGGEGSQSGFVMTTGGDPRAVTSAPLEWPRHSVMLALTSSVVSWGSFSLTARFTSGIPFTPLVGSDVNGDGLVNDRAFIFAADDSASGVGSALRHLLPSLPANSRACLIGQEGRIASQGSCIGPWSAPLAALTISVDPRRLGISGRVSANISVTNLAAAVDLLAHGPNGRAGWGLANTPDRVLLTVRGYDRATGRFLYDVNPHFGLPARSLATTSQLPRIALDVRVDIGRDREIQAIEQFLGRLDLTQRHDLDAIKDRLMSFSTGTVRDLRALVARADSLHLDSAQVRQITQLRIELSTRQDSVYGSLASFLSSLSPHSTPAMQKRAWHDAIEASLRLGYRTSWEVWQILSPQQQRWADLHALSPALRQSREWLEDVTWRPFVVPRG